MPRGLSVLLATLVTLAAADAIAENWTSEMPGPVDPTPIPTTLDEFRALQGQTQVVYLDFDSQTSFSETLAGVGYSAFERQQILELVAEDYAGFNVEFTLSRPTSKDFSTIFFNETPDPFDGAVFGIAEQIDFRNIDRSDNAFVDISPFSFPTDHSRVLKTADTTAHELGHILGLRHHDGFGPIGSGVNFNSRGSGFGFPGPGNADESGFHVMNSDNDNGFPFDVFFGEREAVKLAFNEGGTVIMEDASEKSDAALSQSITLESLVVPNTIRAGDRQGAEFEVSAITVLGQLGADGNTATDVYGFSAEAGDVLNLEVVSEVVAEPGIGGRPTRFDDYISPIVRVLDASFEPVPYFEGDARNDLGPEGTDAIIVDLLLPASGEYFIEVSGGGLSAADDTPDAGSYELYAYVFGVDSGPLATSAGDFNGDGVVDAADFSLFRDSLGQEVAVGAGADGNANGMIDPEDYRYWLGNYGRETAIAAVPEPATTMLMVLAVAGLAGVRRG